MEETKIKNNDVAEKQKKSLNKIAGINYFKETNDFFECLGGTIDFQHVYNEVMEKKEREKEEQEQLKFYKEINYTLTPGQEDEINRYNEYCQSMENTEIKNTRMNYNYNESSDSDSDY